MLYLRELLIANQSICVLQKMKAKIDNIFLIATSFYNFSIPVLNYHWSISFTCFVRRLRIMDVRITLECNTCWPFHSTFINQNETCFKRTSTKLFVERLTWSVKWKCQWRKHFSDLPDLLGWGLRGEGGRIVYILHWDDLNLASVCLKKVILRSHNILWMNTGSLLRTPIKPDFMACSPSSLKSSLFLISKYKTDSTVHCLINIVGA